MGASNKLTGWTSRLFENGTKPIPAAGTATQPSLEQSADGQLSDLSVKLGESQKRVDELTARQQYADAQYQALLASDKDVIVGTDCRGEIKFAAPSVEAKLGWSADDLKGRSLEILLAEDDRRTLIQALAAYRADQIAKKLETERHVTALCKDGSKPPCDWTMTAVGRPDDVGALIISRFRDMTVQRELEEQIDQCEADREAVRQKLKQATGELKQASQAVAEANRSRDDFVVKLGRGLREQLTHLVRFAEDLPSETAESATEDAATAVKRYGDSLLRLVEDAVEFSRIETETLDVKSGTCSLPAVVTDVLAEIQPGAESRGLKVDLQFQWPLPAMIRTDRARLQQILVNILRNSIECTENGKLVLSVRVQELDGEQSHLCFDVIDNVSGMTDAQLSRLLQPFERADASMSQQPGSTCLGPAISKRLAQLLGGDVVAASLRSKGRVFRGHVAVGLVKGSQVLRSPNDLGRGATFPTAMSSAGYGGAILLSPPEAPKTA